MAFAHDIRLIASALGPPPADLVERAHDHDVLVAALAGTTQHARRHAAAGVDLIVAQGTEAGGHTGEVATMVLVPEVVDAVSPVPVLAAGGIARGRQVAAALALGAEGVWCGSVWLTTEEAETAPGGQGQVLGRQLLGHRAVPVDDRQAGADAAHGLDRRVGAAGHPRSARHAAADRAGHRAPKCASTRPPPTPSSNARELATYFVGQVVGSLDRVRPTRSVVLDMVEEFIDTIGRLETLIDK